MLKIAIFIFPDVETLDFCGPLEVFTAANIACEKEFFHVYTFAENPESVKTINGLKVIPDYDISDVPQPDILIIPGGNGTRAMIENSKVLDALQQLYDGSEFTFSVCSGARIPAVLGWLDDKIFTTHHSIFDDVQKLAPKAHMRPNNRFTDNGKILTSAGVAAGIDLSFYLLQKIQGTEVAEKTAQYMEYPLDGKNVPV
jgi:transcriptional regulator GlxA family with amidase domain